MSIVKHALVVLALGTTITGGTSTALADDSMPSLSELQQAIQVNDNLLTYIQNLIAQYQNGGTSNSCSQITNHGLCLDTPSCYWGEDQMCHQGGGRRPPRPGVPEADVSANLDAQGIASGVQQVKSIQNQWSAALASGSSTVFSLKSQACTGESNIRTQIGFGREAAAIPPVGFFKTSQFDDMDAAAQTAMSLMHCP